MPPADRKLRIALAVFETCHALGPAIETLLGEGVPLASLGLIIRRDAAELIAASTAPAQPLARLIAGLTPLSEMPGDATMASPGLISPWYMGLRAPGLWAGDKSIEKEPRLAADLARQVDRGATILTVVSATPGLHWSCARILLEQSCAPILALECSLPSVD